MSREAADLANPYGTPDRWFVLSLVALNYFTLYLHRNLIGYVQPSLLAELPLTDAQVGSLQTFFLAPYCVAQIGVGYLSDRFRRRRVLLVSLTLSVISLAATGLSASYMALVTWRIVLALDDEEEMEDEDFFDDDDDEDDDFDDESEADAYAGVDDED